MSKTTMERRNGSEPHELDSNIVKALSHPLRMRILTRLNDVVASPRRDGQGVRRVAAPRQLPRADPA